MTAEMSGSMSALMFYLLIQYHGIRGVHKMISTDAKTAFVALAFASIIDNSLSEPDARCASKGHSVAPVVPAARSLRSVLGQHFATVRTIPRTPARGRGTLPIYECGLLRYLADAACRGSGTTARSSAIGGKH